MEVANLRSEAAMGENSPCSSVETQVVRTGMPPWDLRLHELWRYRYMFLYLVRRDIVVLYKQTLLGPAWVILQPFLMSFLFSIIFGRIAGIRTDGIPGFLFYFGNNVFWAFLSMTYATASGVFVGGKGLMSKVYFPRLIIPLAGLGGSLFKLSIQFVFLLGLLIYFALKGAEIEIGLQLLWAPVVILQISLVALGVGFLFAWATLKYRDLKVIGNLVIQGWMYLSPVAYPLSEVPPKMIPWIQWNPMTSALELGRHAIFGTAFPSTSLLLIGWGMTVVLFVVGLFSFNVVQRKFIDVI
ncbi:MAG: ABC transporter permease [Verrucomicrobiota bacterium]